MSSFTALKLTSVIIFPQIFINNKTND